MENEKKNVDWLGTLDIGFLTETERDMIIEVLRRNEKLKTIEKKRIVQLKCDLRDVRRRGAKKADANYSSHVCARCNASTGHIINKAHICPICKHKTCEDCRVFSKTTWICVVCFKESKIKAKTGDWFYDTMRADLKPMLDGSTILKQAVIATSPRRRGRQAMQLLSSDSDFPFVEFEVEQSHSFCAPEIKYTPASSSCSRKSSYARSQDLTSQGSMESLSSSTESQSHSSRQNRLGMVETGSIESLRSLRYMGREYLSDSDQSVISSQHSPAISVRSVVLHNRSRTTSEGGRHSAATMPRTKPSMLMHSRSQDVASLDRRSLRSTPDQDNFSSHSKSNSIVQKRIEVSGAKLYSQKLLSQSVPSLVVQDTKRPTNTAADVNRDAGTQNQLRFFSHRKSSSLSNIKERTDANDVTTGTSEIKFSLKFDYKGNHLIVNVVECRNLVYADAHRRTCDPYVKCYLLPDRSVKRKTTAKRQTTSPVFNQDLKFPVSLSELGNRVLEMSVWNSATFSRNSFLGHLQIGLDSWKWQSSPTPHWYPLKQKVNVQSRSLSSVQYNGELSLAVSYKSPNQCNNKHGELHVMIKQAKNLMQVLPNGTVNAFVKVAILPDKGVHEKTKAIGGGVNPLWNITFCLPLLSRSIEDSGLLITVWHKPHGSPTSRKSRSRVMLGGIRLAATKFEANGTMSTEEETLVWKNICKSDGSWTDISLGLRALL